VLEHKAVRMKEHFVNLPYDKVLKSPESSNTPLRRNARGSQQSIELNILIFGFML